MKPKRKDAGYDMDYINKPLLWSTFEVIIFDDFPEEFVQMRLVFDVPCNLCARCVFYWSVKAPFSYYLWLLLTTCVHTMILDAPFLSPDRSLSHIKMKMSMS